MIFSVPLAATRYSALEWALNFVQVLSLFLALLLSSFSAESLQRREEDPGEPNKLQEAFDRIYKAGVWTRIKLKKLSSYIARKIRQRSSGVSTRPSSIGLNSSATVDPLNNGLSDRADQEDIEAEIMNKSQTDTGTNSDVDKDKEVLEPHAVEIEYWRHPEDCCAAFIWKRCSPICRPCLETRIGRAWGSLRQGCYYIVENRFFEGFIFVMIIVSSGTLIAIVSLFMSYFSTGSKSNMNSFKAMRTLRALRPLRALSRWEGMKIVVNALLQAIPSICNVVLVCMVFWLICSIMGMQLFGWGLEDLMMNLPVPPTTIRIVRLFRVGRVLRLVKSARGIRTLLFALFVSLPALFNIGLLLFLTAFVYSIVGMSFFGKVAYYAGIDSEFNFETFPQAFTILLQISTSAGWSTVFEGLSNTDPAYCSPEEGTCGNFTLAVAFLVSYLIMSFMVIINMYIAVILENFSQATEDVQQGLTQDEFDEFYEVWELYDVHARGFIDLQFLEEFVERIGPPLGIPRPNRIKLACLAIPICTKDRIFCMDLLDALTRNFLGNLMSQPEQLLEGVEKAGQASALGEKKTDETQEPIDRQNFTKAAKEPIVVISNTYAHQQQRMAAYKLIHFLRYVKQKKASATGLVPISQTETC
ncbi:hypothetical protein SprV_0301191700 [Sparganum proliferum]